MTIIPGFTFVSAEPIVKGQSGDKKYRVQTSAVPSAAGTATDGRRMLLRISDIAEYDRKAAEYGMMRRVHALGVLTPEPVAFGLCDGGSSCYSLSGWIDGMDAETAMPALSGAEQYALGMKAGEVLRRIHGIPAPGDAEPWGERFRSKVQNWIDEYKAKPHIHSGIGQMLINYLRNHSDIIDSRPQTFIHGDYNIENIIVMPGGEICTIDFCSYNTPYGDPWWDMNNMAWMPTVFSHFYTGQIKGYFDGEPPKEFWSILTYYLAYDALAALTDPYGLNGIVDGTEVVNNILEWTDKFNRGVPTWYLGKI